MHYIIEEQHHHMRLDKALASLMEDVSREKVKKLILEGCVMHDGKPLTDPSFRVETEMEFLVTMPKTTVDTTLKAEDIPLEILFEDDHIMVINKPVGLVVHPGAGNYSGTW